MKIIAIYLITIGLLLGCSHSKADKQQPKSPDNNLALHSDTTHYDLGMINKDLIIEIMEVYQEIDNDKVLNILNTQDKLLENESPVEREAAGRRYINNIYHVDSISKQVISLANQEQYEDIAKLLDSELINFYSHPNSDSYTVYQLHWVMLPLYRLITSDEKSYYNKLIEMWEMNRALIEGVQNMSGQTHQYYERMLFELSSLYDKTGEAEKKIEIEKILDEIEP